MISILIAYSCVLRSKESVECTNENIAFYRHLWSCFYQCFVSDVLCAFTQTLLKIQECFSMSYYMSLKWSVCLRYQLAEQWPRAVSLSGAVPVTAGYQPHKLRRGWGCVFHYPDRDTGRVAHSVQTAVRQETAAARLHRRQRSRGESLGQQLLCSKQREIREEGINYLRGIVLYKLTPPSNKWWNFPAVNVTIIGETVGGYVKAPWSTSCCWSYLIYRISANQWDPKFPSVTFHCISMQS